MIEFDEYYKPGAPGSYGHLFTPEAQAKRDADLREKFASGQGILELNHDMPDIALLSLVKFALDASNGKPFLVMPANQDSDDTNKGGRHESQVVQVNVGQDQRNSGSDASGVLQINIGVNQRNAGRHHNSDGDFHE